MAVQEFVEATAAIMRNNEAWAAPIAFMVAFGESLCFASIIWPGWAILVGFSGALALSGVSPAVLLPMVIAAGLGGTLGYAVSYWIGHYFKDSIGGIWPFSKHPDLIPKGERFFERYGAWSIFLGHFVGPVRAVIPVVAGMFSMRQIPFQIANTASAFIWAAWAVLGPFWGMYYKDQILDLMRDYELVTAAVLFLVAALNAVPTAFMAVPTLLAFVALGAAHLHAGGSFELALLAGAAGAFAGDVFDYVRGRNRHHDFHTIWTNGWSPEAADKARGFMAKYGVLGMIPSKFHTTLRAFAPLAAGGAEEIPFPTFAIVSLISAVIWAAVLLSPRLILSAFGW